MHSAQPKLAATRGIAEPKWQPMALLGIYSRAPASTARRTQVASECTLHINTAVPGQDFTISRAANTPSIPTNEQSISTTAGLSLRAICS
jgi:hypothetical protein